METKGVIPISGKHSKLPWHISEQWMKRVYDADGRLVLEINDMLDTEYVQLANAQLIVTAVNACKAISDNPQAVAEGIEDMYRALSTLVNGIDRDCNEFDSYFTFDKDSPLADTIRQAKAKVERK